MINKIERYTETPITVVDDIMGYGKTSWAIQYMNDAPKNKKFIFIAPFLEEVTRIKLAVTNRDFQEPDATKGNGRKREHLKILLDQGKDIVTTHELFKTLDKETPILLRLHDYTLIMDEMVDLIDFVDISPDDTKMLLNENALTDEQGILSWKIPDYKGRFNDLEKMTELKTLHFHEDEDNPIKWIFPIEIMKEFTEIYVLTYMFESPNQSCYFKLFMLNYVMKIVGKEGDNYYLIPHIKRSNKQFIGLIHIREGKINDVGNANRRCSIGFDKLTLTKLKSYRNDSVTVLKLIDNLQNFFRHDSNGGVKNNMWTTVKAAEAKLQGNGYTKGCFVPHNCRATNDYGHKTACAYVLNRFMHPSIVNFLKSRGIKVEQDIYALSELLQWLFRSAIRNGHPINLYIPSERMRTLLKQWLNDEPIGWKHK